MRGHPERSFLFLLLPLALPAQPARPELTKAEAEGLAKVAGEWVALGQWAAAHGLAAEARGCADLAAAADGSHPGIAALRAAVPGEPAETDRKLWPRQREAAAERAAGHLDHLFHACPKAAGPAVQERYEGYLWRALETAPTERRWGLVAAAVARAMAGKEPERGARLASRALGLKPPGKTLSRLRAALDDAATGGVVLMSTSTHPLRYFLSLPRGFKRAKGRRWPLLVAVDGAGSNFQGLARSYADARGALPCLVAAPCTFSNTNQIAGEMREKYRGFYPEEAIEAGVRGRLEWDEEGVLAMVRDLQAHFDAAERLCVTGFSGGGNVAYMMLFKHPDLLAGAAPACANFADRGYGALKGRFAAADLAVPVFILTGGQDPHREHTNGNPAIPGIEPQTDAAMGVLAHLGYTRVQRTQLPAMGHSPAAREVLERFAPLWLARGR